MSGTEVGFGKARVSCTPYSNNNTQGENNTLFKVHKDHNIIFMAELVKSNFSSSSNFNK